MNEQPKITADCLDEDFLSMMHELGFHCVELNPESKEVNPNEPFDEWLEENGFNG